MQYNSILKIETQCFHILSNVPRNAKPEPTGYCGDDNMLLRISARQLRLILLQTEIATKMGT